MRAANGMRQAASIILAEHLETRQWQMRVGASETLKTGTFP